mmetsp:Transcript_22713/g.68048  ORF Transcript_22713/g.68048 Transcript_22713/m.68048 type:complete len:82 (+) Transcript_22713:191-436(+)
MSGYMNLCAIQVQVYHTQLFILFEHSNKIIISNGMLHSNVGNLLVAENRDSMLTGILTQYVEGFRFYIQNRNPCIEIHGFL